MIHKKNENLSNKLSITLLIIRSTVGAIVLAHGVQKLFGWFGGYGFTGTMDFFTNYIGLPYFLGLAIILVETFGMIALITGLFTRFLSVSLILIMIGAIITVHFKNGFFMNWNNTLQGEGFEYNLLIISMAAVTAIFGGGSISLEKWISKKLCTKNINDGMFFI
jgi:putative oxidoreductase